MFESFPTHFLYPVSDDQSTKPFDVEFQCGVCEPSRLPRHWTSLVIEVEVCFAKGERRKWKCLIDTGAQYSVVRPDVVPPGGWEVAREPRNFQTASGDPLPGGQRGVVASLSFQGTREGKPAGWPVKCRAWLHEASIAQDAILSYEFLRAHRVSVVPHRNCLVFSDRSVIPGVVESATKKSSVSFACESVFDEPSVERDYCVEPPPLEPLRNQSDRNVALLQSSEKSVCVVPDEWVERICEWSGVKPHLDVFASAKNKRFPDTGISNLMHSAKFGLLCLCGSIRLCLCCRR